MNQRAPRVRALRSAGVVLVWLGVVTALFVVHQVWGTAWSAGRAQDRLGREFDRLVTIADAATTASAPAPTTAAPSTTVEFAAPATTTSPPTTTLPPPDPAALRAVLDAAPGDVVARLVAPTIGLDAFVVEGVETDQLRQGPGHYPGTSPIGAAGNAAVAGHRTTYGAPFADLDRLRPGDLISVATPLGAAAYEVLDPRTAFVDRLSRVDAVNPGSVVVRPEDSWVLEPSGDDRLTLTACHPRYSTRQRLVVVARLVTPALSTAWAQPPTPAARPEGSTTTSTAIDAPATTLPESTVGSTSTRPSARLDAAFGGAAESLAPTVLFGLLTVLVAVGATVAARRLGIMTASLFAVVPLASVLWGLFEHLSRLLPVS